MFNPIRPTYNGELDDDYLNAVDNYIDELRLQEKFGKALEKERGNADKRRVGQANERL